MRRARRPVSSRLCTKHDCGTIKYGGGNVVARCCFFGESLGPLHEIDGIMDKQMYKNILLEKMLPHPRDKITRQRIFQHDSDPKHTSKLMKGLLVQEDVNVM